MKLKKLQKEVEFTIEWLPEEIQVEGNCMASGDADFDEQCEQKIYEELDSGNQWAWCTVKVTAKYGDFEGVDYLGCCSYKDETDFKNSGYYQDMQEQALSDLIAQLKKADELIKKIS